MLTKLQSIFEKVSTAVENRQAPFTSYLQLFVALLFIRLTLEFFSGQKLFTLADILHIGLWFLFIVLAFLIQLHLFSKVPILRIARLVITFFSISLTAPIIDLLLFKGQGVKMNYLTINNWSEFLLSYFTMGGASLQRGATPGIRIEIFLLVLACFNYIRIKRHHITAAAFGAFSIYTVLFLSGVVPFFLGLLFNALQLQYQADDQSTILLLLLIDFMLLAFALFRHAPHTFKLIMKRFKLGPIILPLLSFGYGILLANSIYPELWNLNPTTLFHFPLMFGLGLSYLIYATMFESNFGGQLNKETTERVKTYLTVTIFILSLAISYRVFFSAMLIWALLYLLYHSPFPARTNRHLAVLISGIISIASALLGFTALGGIMVGFPAISMVGLFTLSIPVYYYRY
ncbi:MAG: hypothetical protein IPN29_17350 [Saprospiraceae bacterium]|nr:hypothetical protein [Saprospiraceae bacterium]